MSRGADIPQIPGVPDRLVEVINDRLRRLSTETVAAAPAAAGAKTTNIYGGSTTIVTGGGAAGPAPQLLEADVTISGYWEDYGNQKKCGWNITVTPHTRDGCDWANLAQVEVVQTGPGSDVSERSVLTLYGSFDPAEGAHGPVKTDAFEFFVSGGPLTYHFAFHCYNADLTEAEGTVYTVDVTMTPPLVDSIVTASEKTATRRIDGPLRGIIVDVDIVPTISHADGNNTRYTKWINQNHGKGTLWCGWEIVTGSGQQHVTISERYPPWTSASASWTVWVCAGAVLSNEPIPSTAKSYTYTQAGIGDPAATWVTGAYLEPDTGQLIYGIGNFRPKSLKCTAAFSTAAELKQVRFYAQEGTVDAFGNFTARAGDPVPRRFADGVQNVDAQTILWGQPWSMPPAFSWTGRSNEVNAFKITIVAQSRKIDSGTELEKEVLQNIAWPSGAGSYPVAGVTYYTSYAIIIPDAALGGYMTTFPDPPAATGFIAGWLQYSTNPRGSGKPVWKTGPTVQHSTSHNYAIFPSGTDLDYVSAIYMRVVDQGQVGLAVQSYTKDGNNVRVRMDWAPRDTVNQTYDIDIVTENPNGKQVTYTATAAIAVAGTGNLDGYNTLTPVAGVATVDLSYGRNHLLVRDANSVNFVAPIFTNSVINAGEWFVLYVDQDGTDGRSKLTFVSGAGAFASDVNAEQIVAVANTRSVFQFSYHGSIWCLDAPVRTGGAIS